jgi:hypothetical protein
LIIRVDSKHVLAGLKIRKAKGDDDGHLKGLVLEPYLENLGGPFFERFMISQDRCLDNHAGLAGFVLFWMV